MVFFVDRSLGRRQVAEALRSCGLRVEVHDDHFAPRAPDEEWLQVAGQRGWIVLTKDKRIRRVAIEREALLRAAVKAFVVTAGNLRGPDLAGVLVANLRRIVHLARTRPGPFLAAVTPSGVHVLRAR